MAWSLFLSHIPNDCSNHAALLQEKEVCFYSGKAGGDIGPQDNPVLALLRFGISVLYWMSYMPLGEVYQFKITSGISVSH